jgi:rhodanese-related sulfurtransferase
VGEEKVFVPMGSTANKHGRVIGTNITGGSDTFRGVLGTGIVKVFDFNAGTTGLSEAAAREAGFDVMTALSPAPDKAHFYPDALPIAIKLVADKKTRKLLGAQIIGPGVVDKRLDVVITAMTFGATVDDLANLDLAYAPPFSPAMDNIITAANILRNKLDGLARGYSPRELKEKLDNNEDFIILDARLHGELETIGRIDSGNVVNIPLGMIKARVDELPQDKEIVTMCKISLRGYEALKMLEGLGYTNLAFLDGGILLWPYEITKTLP